MAVVYAHLGQMDTAFDWLTQSVDQYDLVDVMNADPTFDIMRSDPRFAELGSVVEACGETAQAAITRSEL